MIFKKIIFKILSILQNTSILRFIDFQLFHILLFENFEHIYGMWSASLMSHVVTKYSTPHRYTQNPSIREK